MLSMRQLNILIDLCTSSGKYHTASFFAQKYAISIRTVQNEITEIRHIAAEFDFLEFVSVPSKGSRVIVQDEEKLEAYLETSKESAHILNLNSRQERVNKIIAFLFATKEYISVQHVSDRLFVSKSTFLNDLKTVKKILKKYDIAVIHKPQKGVCIRGDETDIRTCIIKENIDIFFAYNEYMAMGQISDNLPKIGDILVNVLTEYQYRISNVALQNLLIHIDIIIRRIQVGFVLKSAPDSDLRHDYSQEIEMAQKIFSACSRIFAIPILESEIDRLAAYLRGKSDYPENSYITEEVDDFVLETLRIIKQKFGIDFVDNVQLRISLSLHIMPLLIRLKYNMQLSNELLYGVRKSFQLAFDIASSFSYQIQEQFGYKLIEDEVAYFAIYFNSALNAYQDSTGTHKILIISSLKRSTTLLLRERINHWFAKVISELDIVNVYDMAEVSLENYTVICTTEKNQYYENGQALLISQFPAEEDYRKIKMSMDGFGGKEDILSLFKESAVFIDNFSTKEAILDRLCESLQEYEYDEPGLYDEVIKREAMGGTFYGNYVAMPHPMHPVTHTTCIAVALLEEAVKWDDSDNWARIVVLICVQKDNPRAFQLWSYLSEFITNEHFVHSILKTLTYENFMKRTSDALDTMSWDLHDY